MTAIPPVLYCDDDDRLREAFRLVAEKLGYEYVTVCDADDAWKLVEGDGRFSLIISDHDMPKMSGEQFLRLVRANPATKTTPFILFTGNDGADVERLEKVLGAILINKSSPSFATILRDHLPRT
jgi:CheY-like chemotaxis protein